MNIKSILLGSAAALAVVSGAQAADAIVAAAPEPAEYVKVCDAFGAGYFYIPGSETCLKVGGFVRFQVGGNSNTTALNHASTPVSVNARKWNATTTASLTASAKTASDLGLVEGFIDMRSTNDNGGLATGTDPNNFFRIDSAYLALGGLKAGYFAGYFDKGIGEDSTWAAASKFNSVSYTYDADGLSLGIALDEIREAGFTQLINKSYTYGSTSPVVAPVNGSFSDNNNNGLGVELLAAYTVGGVEGRFIGVYDGDTQNGAVKGIVTAKNFGPGTLSLAGVWSNGDNVYTGSNTYEAVTGKITATTGGKWAIGAAYDVAATDKLSVMPEFQVIRSLDNEQGKSSKAWMVGALTTYKLTDQLAASVDVNYYSTEDMAGKKDHYGKGYVRLQRSF